MRAGERWSAGLLAAALLSGCVTEPAPAKPGSNVHGYVGPAMKEKKSKRPKEEPVVTEVVPLGETGSPASY